MHTVRHATLLLLFQHVDRVLSEFVPWMTPGALLPTEAGQAQYRPLKQCPRRRMPRPGGKRIQICGKSQRHVQNLRKQYKIPVTTWSLSVRSCPDHSRKQELSARTECLFTDWYATWCKGCERAFPEISRLATTDSMKGRVKFVKVPFLNYSCPAVHSCNPSSLCERSNVISCVMHLVPCRSQLTP